MRQIRHTLSGAVLSHSDNNLDGVSGCFGILQFAKTVHIALRFFNPIAPSDTDVK